MTKLMYCPAGVAVALAIGCGGHRVAVIGTGGDHVTATVTYHETTPPPSDAELEIWIADISSMPTAMALVAQGTVPMREREMAVALRYDGDRIADDHTYTLKAVVRSGGQTIYATEADTLVITRGHARRVSLVLRPVAPEPTTSIAPDTAPSEGADRLTGTSWRLEDLAGAPALADVEATLELLDGGRVTGNASCNRFTGTVTVSGQAMTFGPLAVTRRACLSEPANVQETAYLAALGDAERFVLDGTMLQIFRKGQAGPLRFSRQPQGVSGTR